MLHKSSSDLLVKKKKSFNEVLIACGDFGLQQKLLFMMQCLLSLHYSFLLFGPMFLSLTPTTHWCSPSLEAKSLLLSQERYIRQYQEMSRFKQESDNIFADIQFENGLENDTSSTPIFDTYDTTFDTYDTTESQASVSESKASISELYSSGHNPSFAHLLRELTIPKTKDGRGYEKCHMFAPNWTQVFERMNGTVYPDPNWPVESCQHGWTYDYSLYYQSLSSQNDWVCGNSSKVALSQAMFFVGSLAGGPLFGWLADHKGRRWAFILSNFLAGLAGVGAALSPNFYCYATALFVLGFNAYPQINILYILAMEYVTPKYRSLMASVPFMIFTTLGFTVMPWMAYLIADSRVLGIVMYSPMLLVPLSWWIIPESIRWLISKDNLKDANKTILRVAHLNSANLSEHSKQEIELFLRYQEPQKQVSVISVLRTPRLRKHFLALCVVLISIRLLYDAHVRITKFLEYNLFVTFSVASALEVFSGFAAYVLADRCGRRSTLVVMFGMSSVIEAVRAVADSSNRHVLLGMHFLGKFSITTAINLAFMLPVEVLPTVARSQACSIIHTLGFAVCFFSPLIVYWAESCRQCALLVLCCVSALGAVTCMLFLPETLGMDLPDTLQEGEEFARGQPRFALLRRRTREDKYRPGNEESA